MGSGFQTLGFELRVYDIRVYRKYLGDAEWMRPKKRIATKFETNLEELHFGEGDSESRLVLSMLLNVDIDIDNIEIG